MKASDRIFQFLRVGKETRVNDLVDHLGVSRQMVHRLLRQLVEDGEIDKLGKSPHTFYKLSSKAVSAPSVRLDPEEQEFLEKHFLIVTELGKKLSGSEAMIHWCDRQKLPYAKTCQEYINTRKKYLAYFGDNGLIDGTQKIIDTKGFEQIGLDKVWYLDFYAIERFGKTRLGTLLHFAKQGQNRQLMKEVTDHIHTSVHQFITDNAVDAVGFIPPTIRREVQLMKVLQNNLNLNLPHIEIRKVSGEIIIPQKALSKIADRIANARSSMMIGDKRKFKKVLLIDDAVGSGATLNETAIKLKDKGVAEQVIGMAVTGSFKGFEVIQEI